MVVAGNPPPVFSSSFFTGSMGLFLFLSRCGHNQIQTLLYCLYLHWISKHLEALEIIIRIYQKDDLIGLIVRFLISGNVVFCVVPARRPGWVRTAQLTHHNQSGYWSFRFIFKFSPSIWFIFFLQRRVLFHYKLLLLDVTKFKILLWFMPAFIITYMQYKPYLLSFPQQDITCISHKVAIQELDRLNFVGILSIQAI